MFPVTVVQAGPCVVVQLRTASQSRDGYEAVQIGLVEERASGRDESRKPMPGAIREAQVCLP